MSVAFVQGIHRWPVNCQHKGPVMRKMFPFDDVIMIVQILKKIMLLVLEKMMFQSVQNMGFYFIIIIIITARHYNDVIMTTMASQFTSLTVVYSAVYSEADQRKHQTSASLAFVRGINRDWWIPRTKGQLRGKCFHLMMSSWRMFTRFQLWAHKTAMKQVPGIKCFLWHTMVWNVLLFTNLCHVRFCFWET